MKLSPFFQNEDLQFLLHCPVFLVISSSPLSLLRCSLPWDSVTTLLAPGSVLCYRKWLKRAGPWTCPKPLQKTYHPCNFPFAHSQLSLPLASSLAAHEGVPGNEHKTNPGYHSTFYFFVKKIVISEPRSSRLASQALWRRACYVSLPETDPSHPGTTKNTHGHPASECVSVSGASTASHNSLIQLELHCPAFC